MRPTELTDQEKDIGKLLQAAANARPTCLIIAYQGQDGLVAISTRTQSNGQLAWLALSIQATIDATVRAGMGTIEGLHGSPGTSPSTPARDPVLLRPVPEPSLSPPGSTP